MEKKFIHGKTLTESSSPKRKSKGSGRNLRSSFGTHNAGYGMNLPDFADLWEDGGAVITASHSSGKSSYKRLSLGENDIQDSKEFNKRYKELCGEVKVYNIKDLQPK